MQESFVYCWTDHLTNMLYVSFHKGMTEKRQFLKLKEDNTCVAA